MPIQFTVSTQGKNQVVDITEIIEDKMQSEVMENGLCNVFVIHTTASVTTADLDPGTDLDMLDAFNNMVPKSNYRHPHDPTHVGDHIMSSIIGPSVTIPIENGKLTLGTWQRIVLIEFDGPRERELILTLIKEI